MPPRARSRVQQRPSNIQHLLQGGLLQCVRIAAVGAGWVSQNRHLPSLWRRPEYELVGVIDVDGDKAREVAGQYGVLHAATGSLGEVPWLDKVDALVIGAPAPTHARLIEQALACDKHVLIEKPFVTSLADGERLARAAQRAGKVLAVAQSYQFTYAVACLQRDMVSGKLGEIYSLLSFQLANPRRRLPGWLEALPGGLFFEESPQLLSLARRLLPGAALEQAKVVPGCSGATPLEVSSQLRTCRGQGARLVMRFDEPVNEWYMTIATEHGTANLDMYRDRYLFIPGPAREGLERTLQTIHGPLWGSVTQGHPRLGFGYDEVFMRFAAAIRSGTLQPEHIGCAEALAVLKLQQDILNAAHHPGARPGAARSLLGGFEGAALPSLSAHLH